jgi:hypothetical protein
MHWQVVAGSPYSYEAGSIHEYQCERGYSAEHVAQFVGQGSQRTNGKDKPLKNAYLQRHALGVDSDNSAFESSHEEHFVASSKPAQLEQLE